MKNLKRELTMKELKREAKKQVKKYRNKQSTKFIFKLIKNETDAKSLRVLIADLILIGEPVKILNNLIIYFSEENIAKTLKK